MGTRALWCNLDVHTKSSHRHCMAKLWIFSDFSKNFMVHIMMVQQKHKSLEPWTGPSVQFSNFLELLTELCVWFMAVQVWTGVQDRTLTPLIMKFWTATAVRWWTSRLCSEEEKFSPVYPYKGRSRFLSLVIWSSRSPPGWSNAFPAW